MTARKLTARKSGAYKNLSLLRKSKTVYPKSPLEARLETFKNPAPERNYWIHFECPEFTSLCPITNQPDFAKITIKYIPNQLCVEGKSLKLYLFSFRNFGTFHEEAVNRILSDFVKAARPRRATVSGSFNPRGGISITVVAEYPELEA